jgi:segregation and condensation protein A
MLLPSDEDPREELVEKIIEYEKIRAMVKSFDTFPVLGKDTFARGAMVTDDEDGDMMSLCALFFQLIRSREERFFVIRDIKPTLEEKLVDIKRLLEESGTYTWKIEFEQELREKVVTFLAVLEITKLKIAIISQRRPFGTIILKKL